MGDHCFEKKGKKDGSGRAKNGGRGIATFEWLKKKNGEHSLKKTRRESRRGT